MTRPFDHVVVVFNPKSTGHAQRAAEDLAQDLAGRVPRLPVQLRATQYAGHAREIARDTATCGGALIVSVSGDGGYNEVVNGVMDSGPATAVTAVFAAGNANDHRRATGHQPLAEAITAGTTRPLDLLRLTLNSTTPAGGVEASLGAGVGTTPGTGVHYAHSYIGLGISPSVAVALTGAAKGSVREILTTIRAWAHFHPVALLTDHGREDFDSLIFANITGMAKYVTLTDNSHPDDGHFEVVALRHTARWRLAGTALRATSRGLGTQPTTQHYRFHTLAPTPVQLDGELLTLPTTTPVSIDIVPAALQTLG